MASKSVASIAFFLLLTYLYTAVVETLSTVTPTMKSEFETLSSLGLCPKAIVDVVRRGSFASPVDGIEIEFAAFNEEAGGDKVKVCFLTGWDESFLKYGELIQDVLEANPKASIYTMDHRSQGLSGRLVDDPQLTYVENYEDYVADVVHFIENVVKPDPGTGGVLLFGHSMGGLISLVTAMKRPDLVGRLVLTSPMLRMKADMPHSLALFVANLGAKLGLSKKWAPGQGHVAKSLEQAKRELTTDRKRWQEYIDIRRKFPIIAMGGMSFNWVGTMIRMQNVIRYDPDYVRKNLKCPTLLMHGDLDVFVVNKAFDELFEAAPTLHLMKFLGTYHEIHFERDPARRVVVDSLNEFFFSPSQSSRLFAHEKQVMEKQELPVTGRPRVMKLLFAFSVAALAAAAGVALSKGGSAGLGAKKAV